MKFKPPRALFVLIICVLGIGYFGYGIYERRIAPPKPQADPVEQARATSPTGEPVAQQLASNNSAPLSPEEYVALRVPRLPDVPSSAPIYDEITRPVTYPRLSCMYSTDPEMVARNHKRLTLGYRDGKVYGCRCNTQQGTRAVVSFEACMAYVEEGAFDPARPDRLPDPNSQTAQAQPEPQTPQSQPPRPAPTAASRAPVGAAWPSLSGYQGAL